MQGTKLSSALLEQPGPRQARRPSSPGQRWQLWLHGSSSPTGIREDCLKVIDDVRNHVLIRKVKGMDILGLVEALIAAIGTPKRASMTARMFGNVRKHNNREALLVWMLYTMLGKKPPVGWNSPVDGIPSGDPEGRIYPTIGVLFTRALGTPPAWAAPASELESMRKWMSLDALRLFLQQATDADWQQVREDWIAITGAIAAWTQMDTAYIYWKRHVQGTLPADARLSADALALGKVLKLVPLTTVVRLSRQPLVRVMVTGFLLRARKSTLKGKVDSVVASLRTLATMVTDANWQPMNAN